jgi:hypothetical protein
MMNLGRLTAYVRKARNLAKKHGTNSIWILFRLRYCLLRYGFGAQNFLLYGFYSLPLSAPSAYIRQPELQLLQDSANPKKARELVNNKLSFFQRCQQHGLPTPAILGLVDSSQSNQSDERIPLIRTPEHLLEIVRSGGDGKYLFKPARGLCGAGIKRCELKGDGLIEDSGENIEIEEFLGSFLEQQSPFILQKCLLPHPKLRPIMPSGSLGTARVLTMSTDGEARVFMACLKIPTGDNSTDNFKAGLSGNLVADIDMDSGRLLRSFGPGPDRSGMVEEIFFHPDSGEPLQGFMVPCWQELLEIALNGSMAFRELGAIGWDIALTEDGPCLIEGNAHYGSDIHQVALERGQKTEFECLFSERMRSCGAS